MRVLIISYRGNPFCGGQGVYVYHLARELHRLGVEVDVITGPPYPNDMSSFAEFHPVENPHVWSMKTRDMPIETLLSLKKPISFLDYFLTRLHFFGEIETFSIRAFMKIRRLLKTRSYDIIHDVNTLGWGLLPTKLYGIPILSTIHHPLTRDRDADLNRNTGLWDMATTIMFYNTFMQRIVINGIDRVITSFKGGAEELSRAFGLKKKRISVVYNGMDAEIFRNTGEKRRANTLLFVGNTLDEKKGIRYLLEAMTLLPEKVTLTIVDDGPPAKEKASKIIAKLGLEKRVFITGRVTTERLVSLYSTHSVVVVPSLYEGFGLPAAEAMACETPVVSTTSGALREVLSEKTGILVEPKNPRAISEAVINVLDNSDLRKRMGKNGRKRVEEMFTWPVAAANTLEVYREIKERRQKP
jgi:glycosyltransferase involved in cell wall biosynthesis